MDTDEDVSIKCDYICDRQIIQQPIFMHLLKKMLEPSPSARPNHERVISFVIASLPYFKKSMAKIVVKVIRQICWNIEVSSDVYTKSVDYRTKQRWIESSVVYSNYNIVQKNTQKC